MNRFVFVGGSTGIGLAATQLLSQDGHQILHFGRQAGKLADIKHVFHTSYDILSEQPFPSLEGPIDGLVYFPGSITLKPFRSLSLSDFEQDWKINFLGAVKVLQMLYANLKDSKFASVVLFSTVAVQRGMPFHASISSAKAALEGLVRSLAAEWAPSIRVNAVAPSLTDSPLASRLLSTDDKRKASAERHPLKRFGSPEDVAHVVKFLLLPNSSWITGQIIHVDGGLSVI